MNQNIFSFIFPLGLFFINIIKLKKEETFKMYCIHDFLNQCEVA